MKILYAGILLALLSFAFTSATNRTITGSIYDASGAPVENATITAKGTKMATVSDANGMFTLSISDKTNMLEISCIGYQTINIKITSKSAYTVTLKPAASNMDEVVVTGYGVSKKSGAAGTAGTINNRSTPAYATAPLSGSVAGITVSGKNKYTSPQIKKNEETEASDSSYTADFNTEGYDHIIENSFLKTNDNPLSTFSIDVDAASYANVRRFINNNELPPPGAVRIEELINYFSYQYPQPQNDEPFSINTELSNCPWNTQHKLVLIGLQGRKISTENLPSSNLVFLIDVSGSMDKPDKLPLVKSSLKLLIDQLRPQDKVALVVYAGNAGLVLPSTNGDDKIKIKDAIDALNAGGSTAGGQGIALAYNVARKNFVQDGNNRVILCTDGDFNVGISSEDGLQTLIEKERSSGIFLSVLGFGTGNYQDSKMQLLTDKGNGNHNYIDNISEAKKVFVSEFGGTLFTIAKDVKLQIEFNPEKIQGYRLIGYENRLLNKEDFNDDKKDAGELGSGHTVTALYELIPAGIKDTMIKTF